MKQAVLILFIMMTEILQQIQVRFIFQDQLTEVLHLLMRWSVITDLNLKRLESAVLQQDIREIISVLLPVMESSGRFGWMTDRVLTDFIRHGQLPLTWDRVLLIHHCQILNRLREIMQSTVRSRPQVQV